MLPVKVHRSALKRGLSEEHVVAMRISGIEEVALDNREPARVLRLGFDELGRPWELIALAFDEGSRHLVIHTMPIRTTTIKTLGRRR